MAASPLEPQSNDQPLQRIEHAPATARIPDAVGRGVFATGAIVLRGPTEFAIDFVQSLVRPERVAARVVLTPVVATQFAAALTQSLAAYAEKFGSLPREPQAVQPAPTPRLPETSATEAESSPLQETPALGQPSTTQQSPTTPPPQPAITDHYERLKLPDELLGGVYANLVSISQTGSEFCFDFIAKFYPRAVVTTRVYMAAVRVPDLLASLQRSIGG
jgi:hypothetical protein